MARERYCDPLTDQASDAEPGARFDPDPDPDPDPEAAAARRVAAATRTGYCVKGTIP